MPEPSSPGTPDPADPAGPQGKADSTNAADATDAGPVRIADGVRFAFGTLTVLPVRVHRWDRAAARGGMLAAPLAGLTVGLCAAAAGALLLAAGGGPLLAAVASVAVPAVLTRGLHLDGIADVADGLGSNKPADDALRIMKQSDIGPFGVITLVLVLTAQVAALSRLYELSWPQGLFAAALSAVTARLALTLAAREGVPAARPEGLGAMVAGTVPTRAALLSLAVAVSVAAAAGAAGGPVLAVRAAAAVLLGCAAAELLLRHCRRRLGGITGDVFGGLAETAATLALVVLACVPG